MSRLPELAPGATFLPLALEYTFWNERAPEMLAAFGEPDPGRAFCWPRTREARVGADGRRARRHPGPPGGRQHRARPRAASRPCCKAGEGMGGVWQAWRRARGAAARPALRSAARPARADAARDGRRRSPRSLLAAHSRRCSARSTCCCCRARRGAPGGGALVSILVPARDEEANIEACLRAALASRGVAVEVLVMDDGSRDATPAIVRRLAAADPRLRLALRAAAAAGLDRQGPRLRAARRGGAGHAPAVPRRRRAACAGRGGGAGGARGAARASPWSAACRGRSSARSARR